MRTSIVTLVLVGALAGPSSVAVAQPPPPPPAGGGGTGAGPGSKVVGVDGLIALPTEGDFIQLWIGVLGRLEVPVTPNIAVTGRLGVAFAILDTEGLDSASLIAIPLYGGAKYSLAPEGGVYFAGELGLTFLRFSAEFMGISDSDTETEIGMTLGGGYKQGQLDGRLSLWFPTVDETDSLAIMATIGYDFSTF